MKAVQEVMVEGTRLPADATLKPDEAGNRWPVDVPPDPEVPARPERRRFSVEYKLRILAEADACSTPGEIGAILRREGLYSSHLSRWRQGQRNGVLRELTPKKRGPEPDPTVPLKRRLSELERENVSLRKKLAQAETIIDVQKKVSGLLESRIEEPDGRN